MTQLVEDEYGFTAMLKRDTIINAALTPRVRCRVMKFRQKYMEVQLVEVLGADKSEFSLSDKDFREIIGDENWNTPGPRMDRTMRKNVLSTSITSAAAWNSIPAAVKAA